MSEPEGPPLSPLEQIERDEFARGHIAEGAEPVTPRPAATLVLAHPAPSAFDVLLLRRPDTARFAAGAHAFPGGVVDEADGDPALARVLPDGLAAADRPGLVAALRELFEETGILPADARPEAGRLGEARQDLLRDRLTFPTLVERLELSFRRLRAVYFARWITPARLSRRYDTRFFLMPHPGGEPRLTEEHTGFAWLAPSEALERFHAGELPMLFPTLKTLEELADFPDLEAALAALGRRRVEPIRARLLVRGERIRPVMPGDPGYDEAG